MTRAYTSKFALIKVCAFLFTSIQKWIGYEGSSKGGKHDYND